MKEALAFAEIMHPAVESDVKISNCGTFKLLTNAVCSCLSQMGDNSLVFRILEKAILNQLVSCHKYFCLMVLFSCLFFNIDVFVAP